MKEHHLSLLELSASPQLKSESKSVVSQRYLTIDSVRRGRVIDVLRDFTAKGLFRDSGESVTLANQL